MNIQHVKGLIALILATIVSGIYLYNNPIVFISIIIGLCTVYGIICLTDA